MTMSTTPWTAAQLTANYRETGRDGSLTTYEIGCGGTAEAAARIERITGRPTRLTGGGGIVGKSARRDLSAVARIAVTLLPRPAMVAPGPGFAAAIESSKAGYHDDPELFEEMFGGEPGEGGGHEIYGGGY